MVNSCTRLGGGGGAIPGSLMCRLIFLSICCVVGSHGSLVLEDHEENTTMYRKLQQAIEDSKSDTEAGNWSLVKKDFSSVAGKPARIATLAYHFPFGDHEALRAMIRNQNLPAAADNTGGDVWMAALLLAHYLTNAGNKYVDGRKCIELGMGTGIVSLAATRAGASWMVGTDGNAVMVSLAEINAYTNLERAEREGVFSATQYMWGGATPLGFDDAAAFTFDTVLISDVLYSTGSVPYLLQAIEVVCADDCDVILTYEDRRVPTHQLTIQPKPLCYCCGKT